MLPIVAVAETVTKVATAVAAVGGAYLVIDECIERTEKRKRKRKRKSEKRKHKALVAAPYSYCGGVAIVA